MSDKPIAIASDHAGFELKRALSEDLADLGHEVLDLGPDSADSVDYPDFAGRLAQAIGDGRAERGVLVCGTGIGIAMAANRFPGIRAAPCQDASTARLTREHNDANVLALGARIIGIEVAKDCLKAFLGAEFLGGRHARRVAKLSQMGGR